MHDVKIAISHSAETADASHAAGRFLTERGYRTELLPSVDPIFEQRVRDREFDAVIDFDVHGLLSPMSDRLTAVPMLGLPWVLTIGGLTEATAEQLDLLGNTIVSRASASAGPVRIVYPLKSTHSVLLQSIRNWVYPPELLVEVDDDLNSESFGQALAQELLSLLRRST